MSNCQLDHQNFPSLVVKRPHRSCGGRGAGNPNSGGEISWEKSHTGMRFQGGGGFP